MLASKKHFSISRMVYLAILTALIIVLQTTIGGAIKIGGTSISLVLIPIVLGAMLLGPVAGAWLGFVFGLVVYIMGVMGLDGFTFFLFSSNPFMTAAICLVKSTAAGFLSGLVFKILKKLNSVVAVFVAAAIAPIVNTGLFILGCLMISGTISSYISEIVGAEMSAVYFLIIVCAGINFIIELAVNVLLAPALHRIVEVVSKRIMKR